MPLTYPLRLPPKELLVETSSEDPFRWYFTPGVGYVYKKRLINTLTMLGRDRKYRAALEIAFGSGLMLPELAARSESLFGLEMHEKIPDVRKMLEALGIKAHLDRGSLLKMPYEDGQFDAIVAVSVLEHIKDLAAPMAEIDRVLAKDGVAVLSFPVRNVVTDTFFKIGGVPDPRLLHPSSHWDIVEAARKAFKVEEILAFPWLWPLDVAIYCSIRCVKK